jgi:hypothetical protein
MKKFITSATASLLLLGSSANGMSRELSNAKELLETSKEAYEVSDKVGDDVQLLYVRKDGIFHNSQCETPYYDLRKVLKERGINSACALATKLRQTPWVQQTLFWVTLRKGDVEIMKILIQVGFPFDEHYAPNNLGMLQQTEKTALEMAQSFSSAEMVALLRGYENFWHAIENNAATEATVKNFLADGFYVNARSMAGSLLKHAVMRKNLAVVKALVEAGASADAREDFKGRTALNYANLESTEDIVRCLLVSGGANLTIALLREPEANFRQRLLDTTNKIFSTKSE